MPVTTALFTHPGIPATRDALAAARLDGLEAALRLESDGRASWASWTPLDAESGAPALLAASGGSSLCAIELAAGIDLWVTGTEDRTINHTARRLLRLHQREVAVSVTGPVLLTGRDGRAPVGLSAAAQSWLMGWLGGCCTALEVRGTVVTSCTRPVAHPNRTHAAAVGESQWLWEGKASRTLADLAGTITTGATR